MRTRRIAVLGAVAAVVVMTFALAQPASGAVIDPGCTGSVTFPEDVKVSEVSGNVVTESHPLSPTVTVPSEATVTYTGMVNVPKPDGPVDFAGGIDLRVPLIGGVTIVEWPDPPGQTEEIDASGSYTYSLPSFLPKGTGGLELTARHAQQGETCVVKLNVALAGEPGATGIILATVTALFGALTLAAGVKKKGS